MANDTNTTKRIYRTCTRVELLVRRAEVQNAVRLAAADASAPMTVSELHDLVKGDLVDPRWQDTFDAAHLVLQPVAKSGRRERFVLPVAGATACTAAQLENASDDFVDEALLYGDGR